MASKDAPIQVIAAADLGSNSFHLVVARVADGLVRIVDKVRETVAIASGLDDEGLLTDDAQARALACLARFGQRLRELPKSQVRVVGTDTFRRAKNAQDMIARARKVLGHPIEILPGHEEARLIYLGVAHSTADSPGRRLVVDIGGGSTECIIGERFDPVQADSLYMGCLSYTREYFAKGIVRREMQKAAELAARVELEPIVEPYRALGWNVCIGSSGTILAVEQVLRAKGWSEGGITLEGLARLRRAYRDAGHVDRINLPGLPEERAKILPGGLAILCAVFRSFGLERMETSNGALREGLLYDVLGRIRHDDVRDRAISRLAERYHADLKQAARVEACALACLDQLAKAWEIDPKWAALFLGWAARLHEIGLSLRYAGYHKHSAYLVANSDLTGFSRQDQQILAALVLNHRRKVRKGVLADAARLAGTDVLPLCVMLRLAVVLCRNRNPRNIPEFKLVLSPPGRVHMVFPTGWLDRHPLTRADLHEENRRLAQIGVELSAE